MSGFPLFQDSVTYNDATIMACPLCGDGGGLHIDGVQVAARQEDGDFRNLEVDGITGYVKKGVAVGVPAGDRVGEGRRHRIALTGWCEFCCHDGFAIIFTQHKGATIVEVKSREWVAR